MAFVVTASGAQTVVAEYDWAKLAADGQLSGGVPVTIDGRPALKITNTNDAPLQVQLLNIVQPPITGTVYGITGELKYEGVRGDGYLEMWSCFAAPSQSRYFSRTLGGAGDLMARITGTSDWRPFLLPFDRTGSSDPPIRLEINLFLPGRGTVFIGPVKLVEFPGGRSALTPSANAWWSDRTAGLIGGIGGASIGCLAGLLAWLASRGMARSFVLTVMLILMGLGVVLAIGGLVAVLSRQPYAVWFPLVLGAGLLLAIIPFRFRQFQRQYHDMEMRRMASVDAWQG